MNPVEEFLLIKRAANPGAISKAIGHFRQAGTKAVQTALGSPLALGLGVAGGAAMVAAGGIAGDKAYMAVTKKRDFNKMMETNPHLKPYQRKDPKGFNSMFSALRAMNPDFTQEPLVAGAYMHEAMETPPEERGMVAVKALQALKAAPPGRGQQIAELGAREFGSGVRAYREKQAPLLGTHKTTYKPIIDPETGQQLPGEFQVGHEYTRQQYG